MESRRFWISPSSRLPSFSRASKLLFFAESVLVSCLLPLSSLASSASRSETVLDSAERPVAAFRTSGGESLNVSEIVSKLLASCLVSRSPMVSLSPLNAWVTSYGDVVRLSGIRAAGFCAPAPTGSSARYLSPSRVLMAMATVLESPTQAPLTLKDTFTLAPSSATAFTWPTRTPAIRTSSPGLSPADSVKSAVYVVPPPMKGSESAR